MTSRSGASRPSSVGEYLAKGRQVYVEGRLKTDKWQDKTSGQERSRVKVVADSVRFLGGGGAGAGARRGWARVVRAAGSAAPGAPDEGGGPPAGFDEGPGGGGPAPTTSRSSGRGLSSPGGAMMSSRGK